MKINFLLRIFLFVMIAGLLFLSCSPTGTSSVTIHINLGLDNKAAFNAPGGSIIDRILHFFAKDAKAQTAPLGIISIGLTVTGEGMSTINNTYPADTSTITLDVPAGPARVFQVTAYRLTGDWGGSSAAYDLEAGQSVEIPITMAEQFASVAINPAYPNGTPASTTLTYTVNVTTSGQVVLSSATFTPGTPINVPAGASKDFEVLVNTPSVTFRGIVLGQNLTAGSSVTLPVNVTLYETRIVLPDYNNHRIIQINDSDEWAAMNYGWIVKDVSNLTNPTSILSLNPYDVDFDSSGRIYIANPYGSAGPPKLFRLDDISSSNNTWELVLNDSYTDFIGLAIDRINHMIYLVNGSQLYRCNDYDCSVIKSDFDMGSIDVIRGIDINDSGLIFIAQYNSYTVYNPNLGNGTVVHSLPYTGASSSDAWDMGVKGSRIFGAFVDTGGPSYLIEFSLNTSNQLAEQGIYSMSIYGPRRFIKTLSDKIYYIDENFSSDRISVIDDILGTGRIDFGSNGTGTNQFDFFF